MTGRDFEDQLGLRPSNVGGDPSEFTVRIDSIRIQDGDPIELPRSGVTLIVGGNNSGKSTLLRQMHGQLISSWGPAIQPKPRLLEDMRLDVTGTVADALAWLAANSHAVEGGFHRNGVTVQNTVLPVLWGDSTRFNRLDSLGHAITLAPNARSRFEQTRPSQRRADIGQPATAPLHYFEDSPALMAQLDTYANNIFGTGLELDRLSAQVMVRFGKIGIDAPRIDNVTPEYRNALTSLLPIEQQGDGIASTLGLLIPLLAGRNPIAFIDEPEAFLHPPQAFKLGQIVATVAQQHGSQVVVATHDKNFVAGVLSQRDVPQLVIRLERVLDVASAHVVSTDQLRNVWSSALLRHSNILDGLFHRAVVIAEDERDCVFYAAALESAAGALPGDLLPSDVLFISAHGKSGATEMSTILSSAHVPVVAALDLDALRDKAALKRTVAALRGDWSTDLDRKYEAATAAFKTPRKAWSRAQILAAVGAALGDDTTAPYGNDDKRRVNDALAVEDPWTEVKKYGLSAFRADPVAARKLIDILADQGVVLLEAGELEGLAPGLGVAKGKRWLAAALDANAHKDAPAKAFATKIAEAIITREAATASRS